VAAGQSSNAVKARVLCLKDGVNEVDTRRSRIPPYDVLKVPNIKRDYTTWPPRQTRPWISENDPGGIET